MTSMFMKLRPFTAELVDAEGVTYDYAVEARTRRGAERKMRRWVAEEEEWGSNWTLKGFKVSTGNRRIERARRLLVVAGVTFGVAGPTIAAVMLIGLSLEGAL